MKKIVSVLCALSLLMLVPNTCSADAATVIDELGLSIQMPNDTYIITQNTDSSDSVWESTNLDPKQFLPYMEEKNIYMLAYSKDLSYDIWVLGLHSKEYKDVYNMSQLTDEDLLSSLSSLKSTYEKQGLTIDSKLYKTYEYKFYSISGSSTPNEKTVFSHCYLTVVNGIGVMVYLHSYDGPLTEEHMATLNKVVDSIKFKEILPPPASSAAGQAKASYNNITVQRIGLLVIIGFVIYFIRSAKKGRQQYQ